MVIVEGGDCAGCSMLLLLVGRQGVVGAEVGHDSGVRDGESCRAGIAHSSEFENGVKEADAALSIGDGVGSGAGSAHSSDLIGDGVGGGAGVAHSSGGDDLGGVVVVVVGGTGGWGLCRGLRLAKRLRQIRRSCAMRCSRAGFVGVDGWWGVVVTVCWSNSSSVCGCGCGCVRFLRCVNFLRCMWRSCAMC